MAPKAASLLLTVGLLCGFSSGCYWYRPVTFKVRDAETDDPIEGAQVTASYAPWFTQPRDAAGETDVRGEVLLKLADFDNAAGQVAVTCRGYQSHWGGYQSELPGWPFREATLHLYREPSPTVVLIIPNDYRGLIDVFESPLQLIRSSAGRRLFKFHVVPGQVTVLRDIPPTPLNTADSSGWISFNSARYEDGRIIHFGFEYASRRRAGTDEVAIWWLNSKPPLAREGMTVTYVVGTYADWVEARRRAGMSVPRPPTTKRRELQTGQLPSLTPQR